MKADRSTNGDDQTEACPDCGSASISMNSVGGPSPNRDAKQYRCSDCFHRFDEPAVREQRGDGWLREDSLAAQLSQTDPDRVSKSFARAVREGATLVRAGDRPQVATTYVADEHGLDDRSDELREAICERVESETDWLVSTTQDSSNDRKHLSRDCPNAPDAVESASAEQVARLEQCRTCTYSDVPAIEDHEGRPA